MILSPHTGQHRKRRRLFRRKPAADIPGRVLAEPEAGDMTLAELREFVTRAEWEATAAGTDPDDLHPRVAVRHGGALKGIWVRIPP